MYLVVNTSWAQKHPREAAKIQVAHLLRRLTIRKGKPQKKSPGWSRKRGIVSWLR